MRPWIVRIPCSNSYLTKTKNHGIRKRTYFHEGIDDMLFPKESDACYAAATDVLKETL